MEHGPLGFLKKIDGFKRSEVCVFGSGFEKVWKRLPRVVVVGLASSVVFCTIALLKFRACMSMELVMMAGEGVRLSENFISKLSWSSYVNGSAVLKVYSIGVLNFALGVRKECWCNSPATPTNCLRWCLL